MIPFWPGLVEESERRGWEAGTRAEPYSPLLQWGVCPEADDAFTSAYWHGLAYGGLPRVK